MIFNKSFTNETIILRFYCLKKKIRTGIIQAHPSFINRGINEEIMKETLFRNEFLNTKGG